MDLASEFPLDEDLCYLNHAAVAPWPRRARDAVIAFATENAAQGARNYPQWMEKNNYLKNQIAELINADSEEEIALVKNTSEGLSFVANGIDWAAGDEIVISDEEFPSNRVVWEALAPRGVKVVQVPLRDAARSPEQALIDACGPRTRLLAISAVQYASGLRMDLETLGQSTRDRGILFCVDAIQRIGAEPFDVQAIGADFAIADGHKWMLGPEGLGLFYIRRSRMDEVAISEYGWNMLANAGNYDTKTWAPATSARRYECGSPNVLGAYALSESLALLQDFGMAEVARKLISNTSQIIDFIDNSDAYELLSPREPGRYLGIAVGRRADGDDDGLFTWLKARGVVCARRGGGIRFSPHFYTPQRTLDRLFELLSSY